MGQRVSAPDIALDVSGGISVNNGNPNGQASMANSSPVVLPSNQVPAAGSAFPSSIFPMGMQGDGGTIQPLSSELQLGGSAPDIASDGLLAVAIAYRGTAGSIFLRNPDTFKTISATASGDTAVWTPTSGKAFRLMRYCIEITSNASLAAGAVLTVKFRDATTDINLNHSVFVPTTAVTTAIVGYRTGWIDLGNGILSGSADNVLNINLSAALVTGVARVIAIGTQE